MARDEEIHGKKRPAPADPDAQPLAKRFGRLRIGKAFPFSFSVNGQCNVGDEVDVVFAFLVL